MRMPAEDLVTGNTGSVFDTQSYAWVLTDWLFTQLSTDPFFTNFTVKRISSALPVELWSQVPFLGIFLSDEPLTPVGDFDETTIRFTHNVMIGFQIILRNNDSVQLLKDIDSVSWFIMRKLFRMDALTNAFDTGTGVALKGIPRGRVSKPRYGLTGTKNETPVAERVLDLTFQFESEWYPYGFVDLQRITVTTAFPIGGTSDEQAAIQQVKMVYEFNPDSVPTPLPPDPALTSISPITAVHGTAVIVTATGVHFDSTCEIVVNGVPEATTLVSSTQLTATIPSTFAAGAYNIAVQNNVGATTAVQVFTLT